MCHKFDSNKFQIPPTCKYIADTTYERIEPNSPNIATNDTLSLDFVHKGSEFYYIDLHNSYLYLKASITHADKTPLSLREKVAPINNTCKLLFVSFSLI